MKTGSVVIHTAFIGDLVLLTPLLDRLRKRFPEEPLHLVTTPVSANLFEMDRRLDSVITFDKRGEDAGLSGFLKILRQIRSLKPRRLLLPHRYLRSSLLGVLAGADEIYGFKEAPLSVFFKHTISYPGRMHETRRMFSLLEEPPSEPLLPELVLGTVDLMRFDLPERYLVLAPGSVWHSKRWQGYDQLGQSILKQYPDLSLVLVGVEGEGDMLTMLRDDSRVTDLTGATDLRETAAVVMNARALVCNDSAALHLGQAVGTPLVAVFGSTVLEFGFGPQGRDDRVVSHSLDCRPCALHGVNECKRDDFACLTAISAEEVMSELMRLPNLSA
jgi:heptosyltransferase II